LVADNLTVSTINFELIPNTSRFEKSKGFRSSSDILRYNFRERSIQKFSWLQIWK